MVKLSCLKNQVFCYSVGFLATEFAPYRQPFDQGFVLNPARTVFAFATQLQVSWEYHNVIKYCDNPI